MTVIRIESGVAVLTFEVVPERGNVFESAQLVLKLPMMQAKELKIGQRLFVTISTEEPTP